MGKMTLYLVLGFSLLYMILGNNSNKMSSSTIQNMADYNARTVAQNIAVSGANMAANEIFLNNSWTKGFKNVSFLNGQLNASVIVLDKVQNIRKLTATGTFGGVSKSVEVTLRPSKFSKFAYYSTSEGKNIWWTGNDTVWGPFHTQDYLRAYHHPVFYGKATSQKKLKFYTNKNNDEPKFYGGYEQGVNLPLPNDGLNELEANANSSGLFFDTKDTVYITFQEDSIRYKFAYNEKDTIVYLPSVAPNGAIFAKHSTIRLKGVVKGQYSVGCSYGVSGGTVFLDDDIVYKTNPLINPSSTDLLGIVAGNKVLITDNAANHNDINIHASIYSEKGGFGADDYASRPVSGNINLVGGIIQDERQPVGTFGKSGIVSGFAKRYRYDDRLMLISPPYFPGTGGLEIVSWFE